jgi:hypothetical protein
MTKDEKAKIILEKLEEVMNINWNMEGIYIKAITLGLKEIEKIEKSE